MGEPFPGVQAGTAENKVPGACPEPPALREGVVGPGPPSTVIGGVSVRWTG